MNLDKLRRYIKENIKYEKISKYQSTTRDIAFLVKDDLLIGNASKIIRKLDKLLNQLRYLIFIQVLVLKKGIRVFAINILMQMTRH